MVLGKLPLPGRPANNRAWAYCAWVGAGGVVWTFSIVNHFSLLSSSLWETALYRLILCLKGTLNLKQPTNHRLVMSICSQSM